MPEARPLLGRLFSPIRLNRLRLPNRLLMSSMHLNLDECDDAWRRMAAFYALRAREGVGLIVSAGCAPDEAGKTTQGGFALCRDDEIAGHRLITGAVHEAGGRIALQILHFGREAFHGGMVSSSAERLPSSVFTPKPLSEAEIQATIAAHADCAARAVAAGYDAIELLFGQGFLVHQFLAPACNKRTDRWGGGFDNRARLAVEIAAAVRRRVGADFPLIFRLPCMDLLPDGLGAEESMALIGKLLPYGIDLLNVSIGWHESEVPTIAAAVPRAAFADAARLARRRYPQLKLAVSNRVNDPRDGEALLLDGCADVIAMARPFLADPALASKAESNRFDEINACIACNQRCLDHVLIGQPVGCSVNPDCGLPDEGRYPPLPRAMEVAVAGGGISGMGAALFLARRGARVTLFEAGDELGGQLRLAARIPQKEEFAATIRHYRGELLRAGVAVRLGCRFDERALDGARWDHVVLAQGAAPRRPEGVPGLELPHVRDYAEVLEQGCPVAFPVVVIGGGGIACDLAKYLAAKRGKLTRDARAYLARHLPAEALAPYLDGGADDEAPAITLLQRSGRKFAHRVGRTTRWILMDALRRDGVRLLGRVEVVEITGDAVIVRERGGAARSLPARSVVIAAGQTPRPGPEETLRRAGIPCTVLGAADGGVLGVNLAAALQAAYRFAMELR
ncbi:FAD-dependent oxidoreductase [Chromobacterium violaceum]|uniref:FAD-dependent oxidoreductase n=1 Tax=Chromobacterium violaceum TaxID=536 RepID=UPI001C8BD4DB|nr:FAD-dependent oxidoreductase [Chromobacterium violaceum]